MNTKLQELTDKIYNDGLERGKREAAEIVSKANQEATEILSKAQAEAKAILDKANVDAVELEKNTKAELRLYMEQAMSALKTEIANLISEKIATQAVSSATNDKNFMRGVIATMCEQWAKEGQVTIETTEAKALNDYFMAHAQELLNQGVTIYETNGIKTDFSITSSAKGYKINFGDAEFIAYFKEFLRPKLVEMLFDIK